MSLIKYRSLNNYLKEKYDEKIYKLSLSCSNSCPNRDGTCGSGGCIFCAEGSGAFAGEYGTPIDSQIENAKKLVSKKSNCQKFIAYFQSYTSTYGNPDYIRECLLSAANRWDIVELSVATRPDCLGKEVMEILQKVNKIKPVTVELGLQTIHSATADFINRGYGLQTFSDAVKKLKAAGLQVVVHIILGLPGETPEMMLQTVEYVVKSGANGIKLQLLHILEGTPLAEMYKRGEVKVLNLEEYVAILKECVKLLPPDMVVHRLTGDGDKRCLLAPDFSRNKRAVLNRIAKEFVAI